MPVAAGIELRFGNRPAARGRSKRSASDVPERPTPRRLPTRSPRRPPPGRVAPPRSPEPPGAPPGSRRRARRRSPCTQRPAAEPRRATPRSPVLQGRPAPGSFVAAAHHGQPPDRRVRPVGFGGDPDGALAAVHRHAEGAAGLVGDRASEERHRGSVSKLGHERDRVLGIRMGDGPVGPGALGDVHGLVGTKPLDVAGEPLEDVDCM